MGSQKPVYKVPLIRPYFDAEELEEIRRVLDSGWISDGPKVREFEEKVAEYLGARHAIAVANCSCALHLSLLSVGVGRGDEVLVADFTFPATGHSVLYCGAKPVFVDVDPRTYNINPDKIEDKVTHRTRAIIPVHTFGQPAEMDEILKIAEKHNLRVVEDAACALGAKYKGVYAGTMGDVGCFSLHARKGITTGEGGLVVTEDRNLADKIRSLSIFGVSSASDREMIDQLVIPRFVEVGYNYKMSDIAAAVGVAQLKKLDRIIRMKRELAKYWDERIREMESIQPPYVGKNVEHIYQSYVALVDRRINRNQLIELLRKRGVQTQIGTYSCHIQPVYKSDDKCPCSAELFKTSLALPMYYALEKQDIDLAAENLEEALGELRSA